VGSVSCRGAHSFKVQQLTSKHYWNHKSICNHQKAKGLKMKDTRKRKIIHIAP